MKKKQSLILKKIYGSTIIEVLVASVILIVIFTIASLTLNNIFKGSIRKDTFKIDNHIEKIIYLQRNGMIALPHEKSFENWQITYYTELNNEIKYLILEAESEQKRMNIKKMRIEVSE